MTMFSAYITCWLASREDQEQGATMVEYSFVIALVTLVVVVAVVAVGLDTKAFFVPSL